MMAVPKGANGSSSGGFLPARRRRFPLALAVVVAIGALCGSVLTAPESAVRQAEGPERSGEPRGERALEAARSGLRDQAEPPSTAPTPLGPDEIASPTEVARDVSPRLRTIPPRPFIPRGRDDEEEYRPPKAQDAVVDAAAQTSTSSRTSVKTITQDGSFAGPGAENMTVRNAPPDPNSAVGPNHIITITNLSYSIYDKSGTTLYGPAANYTLFSGFSGACGAANDGDGVVAYDRAADRFVMTWLAGTSGSYGAYYECVAVSKTADPLGEWYRYAYSYSALNDYPKLAVWSDGYYITYNMFQGGNSFIGAMVCALERAQMLVGGTAQQDCRQTGTAYFSMLASDIDGPTPPPAGAPNILLVPGLTSDYLYAFKFKPDWTNLANGVFASLANVPVTAFTWASGGDSVPQPNTNQLLDDMGYMLMHRLAYRNFGDHQSLVASHAAVVNGITAVRWYELRLNGSGNPSVYQQGTYAPDQVHRWMSSAAMDGAGNIALGYSASSTSVYPGLRATGRLAGDPLNTLTQPEVTLQAGLGSQTSLTRALGRWGDYASMNVDPVDDCTFWFTGEYLRNSGVFNWSTRVVSLRLPNCPSASFGVSVSPTSAAVNAGQNATTTVNTTNLGGTPSTLSFTANGLPTGVTASFAPTSVTAGSSTTLTLATSAGTPPGVYTVTVTGADGTGTATAAFTLTVRGAPNAPGVPTALRNDWGGMRVSTTAPSFDGGSSITSYTFTSNPGGLTCTATAPATACPITGLTPGTSYTFTARATNTLGTSAASGASTGLTAVGRTEFSTSASLSPGQALNVTPNTASAVPVGARLLVYVTADNSSTNAPTIKTVTFPNGGAASCSTSYSLLAGSTNTAGTGIRSGIVSCAVTTAIPANAGVRVTLSATVAKAVAIGEYFVGFASGGTVTTTSATRSVASAPASGTTASVAAGRLVVGAIGYENGTLTLAGDTDTNGGNPWSAAMVKASGNSGATGVSVTRQLKWTTTAATQRFDSTTSTGSGEDWAAFILTIA